MIAAWYQNKVSAPITFTGYCNSSVVETWLEQVLVPTLKTGQIVLLETASFDRKATLQKLLEPLGYHLLALPPHSPDLVLDRTAPPEPVCNRIELLWSQLKACIKHHSDLNWSWSNSLDKSIRI